MKAASPGRVRIVIAFRAHEPVCGRRLVVSPLGRLVAVAEALDAPVALALSNELAHQLARDLPQTFRELRRGYAERRLVPIYTPAHQVPVSLSAPEELVDELRLNQECVHGLVGAPAPRAKVVLPAGEEACSSAALRALDDSGVAVVVMPPGGDRPARVGERLVGAPRVAMELWPDRELSAEAVARVIDETSDGALLVFVHSLRDVEAARRAWGELRLHPRLAFVAPDELGELARPQAIPPRLRRPPSLVNASANANVNVNVNVNANVNANANVSVSVNVSAISGLAGVLDWMAHAFGFSRTVPLRAGALFEDDYALDRLPPRAQVPVRLRLIKAGAGHGLEADEALVRRPFVDAARLCDALQAECRLTDARPAPSRPLRASVLTALDRIPAHVLDPRLAFRHAELEQQRAEGCPGAGVALDDLHQARAARWRAEAALSSVRAAHGELRRNRFRGRARWRTLARHLGELARAVCVSLDGLERAARVEHAFEPTLAVPELSANWRAG